MKIHVKMIDLKDNDISTFAVKSRKMLLVYLVAIWSGASEVKCQK